jgi:hypothetical protein
MGQESYGVALQRPQSRQERFGEPLQARPISKYFLWSCLTDAVRRRASVVKNGPGDYYKQGPFQGSDLSSIYDGAHCAFMTLSPYTSA